MLTEDRCKSGRSLSRELCSLACKPEGKRNEACDVDRDDCLPVFGRNESRITGSHPAFLISRNSRVSEGGEDENSFSLELHWRKVTRDSIKEFQCLRRWSILVAISVFNLKGGRGLLRRLERVRSKKIRVQTEIWRIKKIATVTSYLHLLHVACYAREFHVTQNEWKDRRNE